MNDELPNSPQHKVSLDARFSSRPHVHRRLHQIADMMDQAIAEGATADEAEALVNEQLLRLGRRGPELRPFCLKAGVRPRMYSRRLQRVLVDFGAESAFAPASHRVREHYGIEIPVRAVRDCTLRHGKAIAVVAEEIKPRRNAKTIVTEMDGSMVPIVQAGSGSDGRKGKTVFWREARLCCARSAQEVEPVYGVTLGTVELAGWLWRQTAQLAGWESKTFVHGVGDGASWIVDKFEENFGEQGNYLIDFYHVSEYLSAAAQKWLIRAKSS